MKKAASAAAAAASAAGALSPAPSVLPGEVPRGPAPRRRSLSDLLSSILLFYAPQSRRATGRAGGSFGQLSWCDSQVWTRQSSWKMPLHIESCVLLGKRTRNLQRECFAALPEDKCFSLLHSHGPDDTLGGGVSGYSSLDLCAPEGWAQIRAWLCDVDRILRSAGFAMVRAAGGAMGAGAALSSMSATATGSVKSLPLLAAPAAGTKMVFVSQAELQAALQAQQQQAAAQAQLRRSEPMQMRRLSATGRDSINRHSDGNALAIRHRRDRSDRSLSTAPPLFPAALSVSALTQASLAAPPSSNSTGSSSGNGGSAVFSATASMASSSASLSAWSTGMAAPSAVGVSTGASASTLQSSPKASALGWNSVANSARSSGSLQVQIPATQSGGGVSALASSPSVRTRALGVPLLLPSLDRRPSVSAGSSPVSPVVLPLGGTGGGQAAHAQLSPSAQAALLAANSSPQGDLHQQPPSSVPGHLVRGKSTSVLSGLLSPMSHAGASGDDVASPMEQQDLPGNLMALPTPSTNSDGGGNGTGRFRSPSDAAAAVKEAAAARANRRASARASFGLGGGGLPPLAGVGSPFSNSAAPATSPVAPTITGSPMSSASPRPTLPASLPSPVLEGRSGAASSTPSLASASPSSAGAGAAASPSPRSLLSMSMAPMSPPPVALARMHAGIGVGGMAGMAPSPLLNPVAH